MFWCRTGKRSTRTLKADASQTSARHNRKACAAVQWLPPKNRPSAPSTSPGTPSLRITSVPLSPSLLIFTKPEVSSKTCSYRIALEVHHLAARELFDTRGGGDPRIVPRQNAGKQRRTRSRRPTMVIPNSVADNTRMIDAIGPAIVGPTLIQIALPFQHRYNSLLRLAIPRADTAKRPDAPIGSKMNPTLDKFQLISRPT